MDQSQTTAGPRAAELSSPPTEPLDAVLPRVQIKPGFALIGLFVLAVFYTLHFAKAVLLPVVLAALMALILSPVVKALARKRVPEPVGAALVVVSLVGALGYAVYALAEPATEWLNRAPAVLRDVERKLLHVQRSVQEVSKAAEKVQDLAEGNGTAARPKPKVAVAGPSLAGRLLASTPAVLGAIGAVIVLAYFFLGMGDVFLRKLVHLMPTFANKRAAVSVVRSVENEMARYMATITAINVGLGVVTAAAMYLLGMPNPILWGVMAGVFEFVPYIGAAVTLAVLTLVALLSFDTLGAALTVPAVYFVITTIEGQILNPIIVGRNLTLHPVVIFLAVLFWGWIWGVAGALMAVPILMTFKILCDHVDGLKPIGEFLSGKAQPEPD